MRPYSAALGCSLLLALSACETWQALTFTRDNLSYKDSAYVQLALQSGTDPAKNLCEPQLEAIGVVGAAAITAAVDIITTVAGDELASYLDKKQKEFTSSFAGQVNMDSLITYYNKNKPQLSFNCIV